MPVDYTIASRVPQMSGGGMDPINMLAQFQAMDYRQRQNALAEMQMAQAQREMQREQATAELFARPGFNPLTQQGLAEIARRNPEYFRQYVTPFAGYQAERARERTLAGTERRAEELQPYELSAAGAKARGEKGKAAVEESKAAQELLRSVYLAHRPDTPGSFEDAYAKTYGELLDVAPGVAKKLGPRPDLGAVERIVTGAEEFAATRKPMVKEPGQVVIRGTGRPGEYFQDEPIFRPPNVMSTQQPELNMLAAQGRMPPSAGDMAPPVDPIIAKAMRKDLALKQLPPGPARETAGARMDLRDTLDEVSSGLTGLADAGGIPKAGASKSENWKAAFRKSPTGQALGGLSDSEVNARLAALRTTSAVLKAQLRKGLEMGITQMDAVKEAEKLDAAFLNPDKIKGLSEGYASVEVLRKLLGGGGGAEPARPAPRGKVGEATETDELDSILGIKR